MPTDCLDYSCPITVPAGLKGDAGSDGADGADGISLLGNTLSGMSISSGYSGTVTLSSIAVAAGNASTGDIYEAEALCSIAKTATLIGSFSIKLGTTIISQLAINTTLSDALASPSDSRFYFRIRCRIMCTSTSTQFTTSSYNLLGIPTVTQENIPTSATENMILANTISLVAIVTSINATLTCHNFTVTKYNL